METIPPMRPVEAPPVPHRPGDRGAPIYFAIGAATGAVAAAAHAPAVVLVGLGAVVAGGSGLGRGRRRRRA